MPDTSSKAMIRVVIVADHPLTADVIRRGLRHAPSCDVIGYVDGRRADLTPIVEAQPNVVLIDDPIDPAVGMERIRELRRIAPAAKLILLTRHMETESLACAAAAGIDAAVAKTPNLEGVGALVREVAVGHVFHAFNPGGHASRGHNDRAADGLTARELEILRFVASGASNGRIARELWVTEQTVKFHLSNLYRKLGVANRTEASHYAHVNGLLERPAPAPSSPLGSVPVAA